MKNAVDYSYGFVDGVKMSQSKFNKQLGELTVTMLEKYIDSRAMANSESLHHVYEWGMSGNPAGRLFKLQHKSSAKNIVIFGDFLPSKTVSDTSDTPFIDKANVMENAILIEITPKNNVLAFEDDGGETVFTADTVYVANPGGDGVAGSFGKVIEEFFDYHFTAQVLVQTGMLNRLSNPTEFSQFFNSGAMGGGRSAGTKSGMKYLTVKGVEFE
jgi:hypothetical protein